MKAILRVGSLANAATVFAKNGIEVVHSYFVNSFYPHVKIRVESWEELNLVVQGINAMKEGGCCILRAKGGRK